MKRIITSILFAAFLCTTSSASAGIKDLGDGQYVLENNDLTMTITSDGGKILSFKKKDKEVISQLKWPNSFGSTFWTSPQKEWNWPPVPEFDRLPYEVSVGERLTMVSQVAEHLKYRVTKEFAIDEADNAFLVTYTIKNESNETRQVSPWEITRVPNDGVIFFDAPTTDITPQGLMDFKSAYGLSWYTADEATQNRKINADGKGWLAYSANGLILLKKFQDIDKSQPAPDEAEIQVYVNMRKTFIELESQGAYTTLQPGEELRWTVRWYLLTYEGSTEPSKTLKEKVSSKLR